MKGILSKMHSLWSGEQQATQVAKHIDQEPLARRDDQSDARENDSSGGRPLPAQDRLFFESRLGHDFGQVRVHDDQQAANAAEQANAKAFTKGSNIFFGPGEFSPATRRGRNLLAHELTHTVQQAGSAGTTIQKDPKDKKKEGIGRTPPDADFVKMEGTGPEQDHILFPLDSIDVKPAAVKKLKALLTGHTGPVVLVVRGYASVEGDDEYNVNISAHRAIAVSRVLQDLLPAGSDVHAYAYGKTTDFGDARDNRRVGIEVLDKPERTSTFHPHIDLGIRKDFGTLGTPSLVAPPTFSLGVPGLPKPPLPPPIAPNYFIEIPSIIPPPTYSGAAEAFSARNLRLSDENQDALYQNYLRNYHFFSYFFPNDHKFAGQLADKALGIYYDRELAREHANRMDELYELDKRLGGPGKPFTVPIITPDSLEWVGKKLGIVKDKKKE